MAEEKKKNEMKLSTEDFEVVEKVEITNPEVVQAFRDLKDQGREGGVIHIEWW